MNIKTAASKHIPWKEQIDLLEVDAMGDEYAWDDLLESVEGDSTGVTSARRVATPIPNFHRHNEPTVKTARVTNWDNDFANAQQHARDVLAKMGNR